MTKIESGGLLGSAPIPEVPLPEFNDNLVRVLSPSEIQARRNTQPSLEDAESLAQWKQMEKEIGDEMKPKTKTTSSFRMSTAPTEGLSENICVAGGELRFFIEPETKRPKAVTKKLLFFFS
jgi:hypothetical protein